MKQEWLNALPTPTPAPTPTLSPEAIGTGQKTCDDLIYIQSLASLSGLTISETDQLLVDEGLTRREIDLLKKECAIQSILNEP